MRRQGMKYERKKEEAISLLMSDFVCRRIVLGTRNYSFAKVKRPFTQQTTSSRDGEGGPSDCQYYIVEACCRLQAHSVHEACGITSDPSCSTCTLRSSSPTSHAPSLPPLQHSPQHKTILISQSTIPSSTPSLHAHLLVQRLAVPT